VEQIEDRALAVVGLVTGGEVSDLRGGGAQLGILRV
jgi:hypothetical protein